MPLEDEFNDNYSAPAGDVLKTKKIVSGVLKNHNIADAFLFRTLNITHPLNNADLIGNIFFK
jgi:hypothetical protein